MWAELDVCVPKIKLGKGENGNFIVEEAGRHHLKVWSLGNSEV